MCVFVSVCLYMCLCMFVIVFSKRFIVEGDARFGGMGKICFLGLMWLNFVGGHYYLNVYFIVQEKGG